MSDTFGTGEGDPFEGDGFEDLWPEEEGAVTEARGPDPAPAPRARDRAVPRRGGSAAVVPRLGPPGDIAKRAPAILVVLVLLIAGGLVDRAGRPAAVAAAGPVDPLAAQPGSSPAAALSSTLYCAGATGQANGVLTANLVVANPTDTAMSGTVTAVPEAGDPVTAPVAVDPQGRAIVPLSSMVNSQFVAATLSLDRGGAAAELSIVGSKGHDIVPCTSTASDHWYFSSGATDKDDALPLWLYNPFPDDSIADVSFATEEGPSSPSELGGIVIPARSLRVVDVAQSVRRRLAVATTVDVKRGRLVAVEAQLHAGQGSPTFDPAVWMGSTSPAATWVFPNAAKPGANSFERFTILNPGDEDASVSVELSLAEGAVEPVEATAPGHGRVDVDTSSIEGLAPGTPYSVTVRSVDGVPIVAERVSGTTVAPFLRVIQPGQAGGAKAWALPTGSAAPSVDETIVVLNASGDTALVDVSVLSGGKLTPVPGMQGVSLDAGRRNSFSLKEHLDSDQAPLVIRSDQPVLVERVLFIKGVGISATAGLLLR